MLAETISISTEALVIILLVLLAMFLLGGAAMIFGGIWAWRAGRGSRSALPWFLTVVCAEILIGLPALAGIFSGDFSILSLVPAIALAIQTGLYFQARAMSKRLR